MWQRQIRQLRKMVSVQNRFCMETAKNFQNKRLAIINDLEYEVGDKLEPGGLILRNIHPNHVVVGSAVHNNKKVILPMEEIE